MNRLAEKITKISINHDSEDPEKARGIFSISNRQGG
jgi:hypothetical protein